MHLTKRYLKQASRTSHHRSAVLGSNVVHQNIIGARSIAMPVRTAMQATRIARQRDAEKRPHGDLRAAYTSGRREATQS
jgi:hypothetical protein